MIEMPLEPFFTRYLPSLEAEMRAAVQATDPRQAALFGMLHYHLGWADAAFSPCRTETGKHIRPVLCLLSCEACGGDWQQALPAAAGVELLHNFSLIHDDIEDRDRTRRGRPTLWALWGEAQAINAGDALFSLAQLALLRLPERGVPAATTVTAQTLFNQACMALTGGQHLDLGFESRDTIPVAEYLAMIEGKTAALVACACELGALVAVAPDARRASLRAFGRHLGLAFQIRDDVLGVWGDPAITGKPAGSDIARRKKSLPILHGLEQSAALRALFAQEKLTEADVYRATELLEESGSRASAEGLAHEHHIQALAALEETSLPGRAASALHNLAQMLLNREK
jgi:geranylgeranyl diphosphate synthase type I